MARKLTQEEAEAKTLEVAGIRMVGSYRGSGIKTEFECPFCNTVFITRPHDIWTKKTKSCGCYNKKCCSDRERIDLSNQTFGNLIAIESTAIKRGSNIVWKCLCSCGNYTYVPATYLIQGHTKSCGCYARKCASDRTRKDLYNMRFGSLTAIEPTNIRKNRKIVWKCLCDCGKYINVVASSLLSGNTKSCGCLQKKRASDSHKIDLCNKKFNSLKVIEEYGRTKYRKVIWKCLCDCGNYTYVTTGDLNNGHIKSCGHCNDVTVGQKYYNLVVETIVRSKYNGAKVVCRCDCGNIWKGISSEVKNGHVKSCGHCNNMRNGVLTSYAALDLHRMIDNSNTFTEHNQKIKINNKNVCVDISIPSLKIAVEYDEWYNHAYRQKQDNNKYKKLLRQGWKILRIKAHNNLPTQQQLDKALFELIMTEAKQRTITLPGWGEGPTRSKKKVKELV